VELSEIHSLSMKRGQILVKASSVLITYMGMLMGTKRWHKPDNGKGYQMQKIRPTRPPNCTVDASKTPSSYAGNKANERNRN